MEKTRKLLLREKVNSLYPLLNLFDVTPEQKSAIRFMIDMMDYECYGIEENPYTLEHNKIKSAYPYHAVLIVHDKMVNVFGDEAVMIAKWLDLSLLSHKNINGDDIKRVTFPESQIEQYKSEIIKRGLKLVVTRMLNNKV